MSEGEKEEVRTRVCYKLASVPPDVRQAIRPIVTRKFVQMVKARSLSPTKD